MDTLRLSTKRQIVISKEIRTRYHWEPGTDLIIEDRGGVLMLRTAKAFLPTRLELDRAAALAVWRSLSASSGKPSPFDVTPGE
jgi:AbrB family looped-hinge helix DNA binding protein